jgi:hypothetical protein
LEGSHQGTIEAFAWGAEENLENINPDSRCSGRDLIQAFPE